MFVAIVLHSMASMRGDNTENLNLKTRHIDEFQRAWRVADKSGAGSIPIRDVEKVVHEMGSPLGGFGKADSDMTIQATKKRAAECYFSLSQNQSQLESGDLKVRDVRVEFTLLLIYLANRALGFRHSAEEIRLVSDKKTRTRMQSPWGGGAGAILAARRAQQYKVDAARSAGPEAVALNKGTPPVPGSRSSLKELISGEKHALEI